MNALSLFPLPDGHVDSFDATGAPFCPHAACEIMRGHHGAHSAACGWPCTGQRHAVAYDDAAYSYGHAGGHIGFLTACPSCGRTDAGHILDSPWTEAERERARAVATAYGKAAHGFVAQPARTTEEAPR